MAKKNKQKSSWNDLQIYLKMQVYLKFIFEFYLFIFKKVINFYLLKTQKYNL